MKIRTGFVSNSSSSSFVVVMPISIYDRALEMMDERSRRYYTDKCRGKKFNGIPVKIYSEHINSDDFASILNHYGYMTDEELESGDGWGIADDVSGAVYKFQEAAKELKTNIIFEVVRG